MTSSADALAELDAALDAAGIAVRAAGSPTPPCVNLFGGDWDIAHLARGQVAGGYRIVLVAGRWDQSASGAQLAELRDAVVSAVRGLDGWRLDSVSRDRVTDIAGGMYYSAEVGASRMIDV